MSPFITSYIKSAIKGNPEAQYKLAMCYYNGDGVTQEYILAIKWLKLASEQDHAMSQKTLGYCYFRGNGVKQDYPQAYMWSKLAVGNGLAVANSMIVKLSKIMSAEQISEAKSLAVERLANRRTE